MKTNKSAAVRYKSNQWQHPSKVAHSHIKTSRNNALQRMNLYLLQKSVIKHLDYSSANRSFKKQKQRYRKHGT